MTAPPPSVKPKDEEDEARVHEQGLRWRILKGRHRPDVEESIQATMAAEVASDLVWNVDLSANPLKSIFTQLNTAYIDPPEAHPAEEQDADVSAVVTPYLWPLMKIRALYQMGIREAVVRLDWPTAAAIKEGEPAEAQYRVVPPHCIHAARPHRRRPDQFGYVEEVRERTITDPASGEPVKVWAYDVWDINSEPASFRIEMVGSDGERKDITAQALGLLDSETEAGTYPYLDSDNRPIMPYVLAHAEVQSHLWDWSEGTEIVDGTLKMASGVTWWWDGFHSSSNPQRVGIDLVFGGARTETIGKISSTEVIPTTHKTILQASSSGPPGTGKIAHFPPGMDPKSGLESLRSYEERLAMFAGISPADMQTTGSAQSGIAIQVSRDGQRAAQKRYEPAYRMADQWILATASRMANAHIPGLSLPEDPRGWSIDYRMLGESITERKTKAETVALEQSNGTIGLVASVRKMNPALESDEEAIRYLEGQAQVDAEAQARLAQIQGETGPDTDSIGAEAATIYGVIEAAVAQARPLTPDEMNDLLESAAEIAGLSAPTQQDED